MNGKLMEVWKRERKRHMGFWVKAKEIKESHPDKFHNSHDVMESALDTLDNKLNYSEMITKIGTPIIKVLPRLDDVTGVQFWCPFCRIWHYHGGEYLAEINNGGHRVAHCHNTPFSLTGYNLKRLTKQEANSLIRKLNEIFKF